MATPADAEYADHHDYEQEVECDAHQREQEGGEGAVGVALFEQVVDEFVETADDEASGVEHGHRYEYVDSEVYDLMTHDGDEVVDGHARGDF